MWTSNLDKKYDGMNDPRDYVANYQAAMHPQGATDDIMCQAFSMILDNGART